MSGEVAALARELVRIDTVNPPGSEERAAALLADRLDDAGLETRCQAVGPGRANVIARLRGRGGGTLVLSGHLDTVPATAEDWTVDPWAGAVRDGRLYGRGACDMKGAVAAMAVAVARIARSGERPPGDVVLALTAGEETDSAGARLLVESDAVEEPAAIVVGEPTGLDVALAHKGALWVEAAWTGRAAHGSQPQEGDNAATKLLRWLDPLAGLEALAGEGEHPLLGRATLSLNRLDAGRAPNVVPDRAAATLDYRTLPGADHARMLRALQDRRPAASLRVLRDCRPVETPGGAPFAEAAVRCVRGVVPGAAVRGLPYVTDASAFAARWDAPVVFVGPGDERLAHVADEWVALDALDRAAAVYERLARNGAR